MDAILKLRDKIANARLGPHRDQEITEQEQARLRMNPLHSPPPHRTAPTVR
jgi:hypothetical protein